jgi:hypothetical protein
MLGFRLEGKKTAPPTPRKKSTAAYKWVRFKNFQSKLNLAHDPSFITCFCLSLPFSCRLDAAWSLSERWTSGGNTAPESDHSRKLGESLSSWKWKRDDALPRWSFAEVGLGEVSRKPCIMARNYS